MTTDPPSLIAAADVHRRIADNYLGQADALAAHTRTARLNHPADITALASLAAAHAQLATAQVARHAATPPIV